MTAKTETIPSLHFYRIEETGETPLNTEPMEVLAPSPLVAAFLFAPYGYTPRKPQNHPARSLGKIPRGQNR